MAFCLQIVLFTSFWIITQVNKNIIFSILAQFLPWTAHQFVQNSIDLKICQISFSLTTTSFCYLQSLQKGFCSHSIQLSIIHDQFIAHHLLLMSTNDSWMILQIKKNLFDFFDKLTKFLSKDFAEKVRLCQVKNHCHGKSPDLVLSK